MLDHEGKSALHLASEYGSEEICKALIEASAFVNSKTKAGFTALHFIAQRGHSHLVDLFVKKHGATLDANTMKKQTPLHLASTHGKIEVCNWSTYPSHLLYYHFQNVNKFSVSRYLCLVF